MGFTREHRWRTRNLDCELLPDSRMDEGCKTKMRKSISKSLTQAYGPGDEVKPTRNESTEFNRNAWNDFQSMICLPDSEGLRGDCLQTSADPSVTVFHQLGSTAEYLSLEKSNQEFAL